MIELRWLMDSRSDAHRILQFRAWEVVIGQDRGHAGYGEWQDVPTVNARDAAPNATKEK